MDANRRPIASIVVGERRREDMGDIDALARSLEQYGLIQPIVIDDAGMLVAGGRRLAAAQSLGWTHIDCRPFGTLSEVERQEIELEENLQRKDLTPYERSKTLVRLAEAAAEVDRASFVATRNETPKEGRPDQPGSLRRVGERVNVDPATIIKAQQHVAAVEEHALPPETAQAVAIDYAKAVEAEPELRGRPVAPVVDFYRQQREIRREQAQAEQAEMQRVMEAAGPETPELRQARLQAEFTRAIKGVRELLAHPPETYGPVFDGAHRRIAATIVRDCRDWCDRMERSLEQPVGLRVVGSV